MGKAQSKQPIVELKEDTYSRFAFIGASRSGKSAFVNAVRGIEDEDDLDVNAEILEETEKPTEYFLPSNPQVSFFDMPGYGSTKYPDVESYWKELQLGNFSAFLVFLSCRVTNLDLSIIEKLKLTNKSFFLVRTNIDRDVRMDESEQLNEESVLSKIREDLLKRTDQESVFLICSYKPYKWDFFRLIEAMMNKMPASEIVSTSDLTDEYMADVKIHVKQNGVAGIEKFLKEKLEDSTKVKIRFAITGNSGTGKSSFINAIRGLSNDDDSAAQVGVVETTFEPKEYQHPNNPLIKFVDLPGIGTPTFPDCPTYCEKVGLEDFGTFLIFTTSRFTQHDLELAKKVKSIGKSFFLIRSKIDTDCDWDSNDGSKILKIIREDCMKNLKGLIASENDIFFINNKDTTKWDFDRLVAAISDALPIRQRECLALSLSNITRECIKRKAKFFKAQAVGVATVSAANGAIPIPTLGAFIDVMLLRGAITSYLRKLGLNDIASEERDLLDKKYSEIIDRYKSLFKFPKEFTAAMGKSLGLLLGIPQVTKYVPIVGIAMASSVSFAVVLRYLIKSINELEEVAITVWDSTAKRSVTAKQSE